LECLFFLSLLRPKEEFGNLWQTSSKFILGLCETRPPKQNVLQGWVVDAPKIIPGAVEHIGQWREWALGTEGEQVVFKKWEEEGDYGWGIWECPLLLID